MNKREKIKKAERLEISILLKKKYSLRSIARELERSPNSVSREIKTNSVGGIYDPKKAQWKARVRRRYSKYQGMKIAEDKTLRNYVEERMKKEWSPEIIAGRLKEVDQHIKYAGKGAIYKYIYSVYGRQLEDYLYHNIVPKKPGPKKKKGEQLKDRVFIDKRPEIIGNRARYGDWEGDFIVSGKNGSGALLVFEDRKSRYALIKRLPSKRIEEVNKETRSIAEKIKCFHSLTIDNDISFKKHSELSNIIEAPIYFCHPYHSWEKGGIENLNKLIRRYIPKRTDISRLDDSFIKDTQDKLNNKPRKCLNFKTPYEVMIENNQFKCNIYDVFKTKNTLSKVLIENVGCPN